MKLLRRRSLLLLACGLAFSPYSLAAESDFSDDTMVMVEEGATPEDVVNVISLPTFVPGNASMKAGKGLENSNSTREQGREFGQQMADDAKSNDVSEQVRENMGHQARNEAKENNGQGGGRP